MNQCTWCIKSQPEWDAMVKDVEPRLDPRDAIVEIESQFMDEFKKLMEERGHVDIPRINSFPTWVVVTPHEIKQQEGREYDDYIKVLEQIKSITPKSSKTPKTKTRSKTPKTKTPKTKTPNTKTPKTKTPKTKTPKTKTRSKSPKTKTPKTDKSRSDPRLQLIS